MKPEEWSKIRPILERALELPPDRRAEFLTSACSDDPTLRARVESLVADSGATAVTGEEAPAHAGHAPAHPTRIGRYHVKRLIGSGGMGAVYEALQEQPRRTVALKVMRRGLSSRSAMRRFEYEAQLLARLRHPGIAQIFEAGTHDDGTGATPFFAMEYIPAAKSLTEYAMGKRLSTRERLELFLRVCDAVHHGHTKGVIHRDLKPANILVDSSGQPKIIDFGVARATDSDLAVTTLQTDVGQLVGTLQYMSPEQCAADPHDIDTRSDVYALGVILYELLCEKLPYDIAGTAMFEAARIVREKAPVRPSTVNRSLRGDLETITLKALEKDRDRRYRSASDLADDLKRYLSAEPISARPPSLAYQVRMFTRRNRALVVLVSTVMLLLVAATLGTSWGLVQVNAARARAQSEASTAKAINEFLRDMLTLATPARSQGRQPTVREAVDLASQKLSSFGPEQAGVEAAVRAVIGGTYRSLGLLDAAEPHLRRALDLRRERLGESHPDTLVSVTDMALLLNDRGQSAQAAQMLNAALAAQVVNPGRDDPDTLRTRAALGWVLRDQGKVDEAESHFQAAYDGLYRTRGRDAPTTIKASTDLAMVLIAQGKLEQAGPILERAVDAARRVLGERHPDYLYTLNMKAWLLSREDRHAEAAALYRQVVQGADAVLRPEHPWTMFWKNSLGWTLVRIGEFEEAERIFRDLLDSRRRVLGEDHRDTLISMSGLARALIGRRQFEQAEPLARDAYERLRAKGPALNEQARDAAEVAALLYEQWGKPDLAAPFRAVAPRTESPK